MIWVIADRREEDGSFPTYKYYKKAYRHGEIDIYCAGQNDDFSFINHDDVVLMRTRDENIVSCVRERQKAVGFKSTIESDRVNFLTHDKKAVKELLYQCGFPCPKTIALEDVVDGHKYFIKPRFGENSIGIDEKSLCTSRKQVEDKCKSLLYDGIEPIIEEFIEGFDVTTSVIRINEADELRTDTIKGFPQCSAGFQTYEDKESYVYDPHKPFDAEAYDNQLVNDVAKLVFMQIGARHYIRIDFRMKHNAPYILDVNMVPGLAPNGHMSKCLATHGVGYYDFIKMVVNSASLLREKT